MWDHLDKIWTACYWQLVEFDRENMFFDCGYPKQLKLCQLYGCMKCCSQHTLVLYLTFWSLNAIQTYWFVQMISFLDVQESKISRQLHHWKSPLLRSVPQLRWWWWWLLWLWFRCRWGRIYSLKLLHAGPRNRFYADQYRVGMCRTSLAFGVVNYICWFNQGHLQTVHYKNFMQFLVLCFFYTIVVLCNLMSKQFYSVYKLDKATIHYIHSQHKSQDGSWGW